VIESVWDIVGSCKDGRRCFLLNDSVTLSQIMSSGVGPHREHCMLFLNYWSLTYENQTARNICLFTKLWVELLVLYLWDTVETQVVNGVSDKVYMLE
jgi:hypothetical protein